VAERPSCGLRSLRGRTRLAGPAGRLDRGGVAILPRIWRSAATSTWRPEDIDIRDATAVHGATLVSPQEREQLARLRGWGARRCAPLPPRARMLHLVGLPSWPAASPVFACDTAAVSLRPASIPAWPAPIPPACLLAPRPLLAPASRTICGADIYGATTNYDRAECSIVNSVRGPRRS
jgi:hypothetical protein